MLAVEDNRSGPPEVIHLGIESLLTLARDRIAHGLSPGVARRASSVFTPDVVLLGVMMGRYDLLWNMMTG